MISGIGGSYMDPTQITAMRGPMGNPFEKIDSSGDGSLDKAELSAFAGRISEMTGQSVDVDQMVSKLDGDEDGLVSLEEFKTGRPVSTPGMGTMMGGMQPGGMPRGGIQGSLDMLNSSEDEDSSSSVDYLDTNGDGIVDAEEAKSGINYLIQEYWSQTTNTLSQDSKKGSQFNLEI